MKAEKRAILGLPPLPEDSIKVIRNMRAASPPASASDLIEQQQKRGRREHKVRATRSLRLLIVLRVHRCSGIVTGCAPGCWKVVEVPSDQQVRMNAFRAGTLCPQPRAQFIVGTQNVALLRNLGKD